MTRLEIPQPRPEERLTDQRLSRNAIRLDHIDRMIVDGEGEARESSLIDDTEAG